MGTQLLQGISLLPVAPLGTLCSVQGLKLSGGQQHSSTHTCLRQHGDKLALTSASQLQVVIWFKNLMKLGSIIFITLVASLEGTVSFRRSAACKCCRS